METIKSTLSWVGQEKKKKPLLNRKTSPDLNLLGDAVGCGAGCCPKHGHVPASTEHMGTFLLCSELQVCGAEDGPQLALR